MSAVARIGFAYNPTMEAADELRDRAEGWCGVRGIAHWSAPSGDLAALVRELPTTDVLVVLGGDGTFLRAARAVSRGRRAAARGQPRQDRLPLQGRGGRARSRPRPGRRRVVRRRRADGAARGDPPGGPARRAGVLRPERRRRGPRGARPRRPARRGDRAEPPRDVRRRRARRRQPDRLDRLLVLGRRADPRSAQPEPRRDPDRRLPLGHPVGRREPEPGRHGCGSSTRTRPSSASTAGRTSRSRSATSSRCPPGRARSGSSSRRARCRSGTSSGARWSCCRRERRIGRSPARAGRDGPRAHRPGAPGARSGTQRHHRRDGRGQEPAHRRPRARPRARAPTRGSSGTAPVSRGSRRCSIACPSRSSSSARSAPADGRRPGSTTRR